MKKKILILILCICFIFSGCYEGVSTPYVEVSTIKPAMTICSDVENIKFYYAVDRRTNVVYIICMNGHRGGITVALNTDGTPMTAEQLGIATLE